MSLQLQAASPAFESGHGLSFMQQGMLLHSLLHPGSGVDIEQLVLDLHERLDPVLFRQGWLQVMARHGVLRTRLRWVDLRDPVQDVCGDVPLAWEEADWTGTGPDEQRGRLLRLLDADRCRGFDLNSAPLWRLTLIRLGAGEWQLIWTFHHAILDGRSYALLLKEVFRTYRALQAGKPLRSAEPRRYGDYIEWLGEQDFDVSEQFWRGRLEGFRAATPVMIDQISRVSREQLRHRVPEELSMSPGDTTALRAVAADSKITINTIVQGVWAIILSLYASERDIVFGVVRSSRPESMTGSQEMIGLFLNTLPMRVQVDPAAALIPWLRQVRSQWNELRAHEHAPLARIQAWSSLEGRSPLFETTVMYERYQLDAVLHEHTEGAVRRSELFLQTNNKLDFAAFDGVELRLRLDYDHSCIEGQLAKRLLLHARNLLQSIARNPHQTIGALRLIDSAERSELLTRWNKPAASRETSVSLDKMIWRRIAQDPDSVAITHGDVGLSYRELGQRASLLAADLRNKGLCAGRFAAILLNRSIDSAVSALAVLMTGAAYIPIDSNCPIHRIEAIVEDAKPLLLIKHDNLARSLSVEGDTVIVTLDGFDWTEGCGLGDRQTADGEQAAYLIYTSGSTGRPKGVVVPHRAIVNHIEWMQQTFELGVRDRVLQLTSFGFDVAMWEFFGTLAIGGCLVIPPDKGFDLTRTVDTIVRERITILQLVPSLLRILASAPGFANCRSLRHVFCGGEPMPDDLPGQFYGMLPASLHNMYGPTETTIDALHFTVPRDWTAARVPIGLPIRNTQAYVLDTSLEPVPVGVPGELHIGGSQLALGYHDKPALTGERFVDDPFSALAGARLYKTGDIVRRRPDGHIEFLSRRDDQFKIRGVRGELGEVEAALLQFPSVQDCAVILRDGDGGEKQLLAFVAMAGEATVELLQRFLRSRLAVQHIPIIVPVSSVPRSPNGKVDRARLPSTLPPAASGELPAAAYGSPIEETLARIWRELLKREHIKVNDNFFDLGGESLLAVRLAYCIEEATGVRLGIPEIFRSPVFDDMAQLLLTRGSSVRPDVITIQEGAPAGCPIYFIYAGSHEFGLARMLGAGRTIYGVEAGWPASWRQALERGDTSRYPAMEQLVEPFCSAILTHAGSKSFVVAGYSFAGLMAFEAARQLEERGASVSGVLLFDTVARAPSLVRVVWNEVKDVWTGRTKFGWAALTQAARTFRKSTRRDIRPTPLHEGRARSEPGDATPRELSLAWPLMEKLYDRIRRQYRLRKVRCHGILVVANSDEETRLRRSARPDLGWSRFFDGELGIIAAASDHYALPKAYNRALEHELSVSLDRLNQPGGPFPRQASADRCP